MKKGLVILCLLALSYITYAGTVQEINFGQNGFKDFYINGSSVYDCTTFSFPFAPDANGEVFHMLSLKADLPSQQKSSATVAVFFNGDEKLAELRSKDFGNGFARIEIQKEKLRSSNSVKICARTSSLPGTVKISSESYFGSYTGTHFPQEKGVRLELETYTPYVGIPFSIDAVAKNFGTEDAQVMLTYRKQELEENTPEISVLKGETSKQGIAPKCERWENSQCTKPGEYRISYSIVANKAVPFTLLPAVLTFTNVFGEEQGMLSNRPNLGALDPPHKISVTSALGNDKAFAGENIKLAIRVQNISKQRVSRISVRAQSGLETSDENPKIIDSLGIGQSVDLTFNAKASKAGTYSLGCIAEHEGRTLECDTANVTVQEGIEAKVIASVLLALVSAGVFAYFYFKKD